MELIPGIADRWEVSDVVRSVAPRPLFVVSATDDPYSADADEVVKRAGAPECVEHLRAEANHVLDKERFDAIVAWLVGQASGVTS